VWGEGSSVLYFSAWKPETKDWTQPQSYSFHFEDPDMRKAVQLDDLHVAAAGVKIAVIGTDVQTSEVWAQVNLTKFSELANAPLSPWQTASQVSPAGQYVAQPAVVVDAQGQAHVFWAQGGPPGKSLAYAVESGGSAASTAVELFKAGGNEMMREPAAAIDAQQRLHLAWSGGPGGAIYYSRAAAAEAGNPGAWKPAVVIAAESDASLPQVVVGPDGRIYVAYVVPLNERRGGYLLVSEDGGDTWSAPQRIFDAAAAGWDLIDQPALAVAPDGRLQVAFVQGRLASNLPSNAIYTLGSRGSVVVEKPAADSPQTKAAEAVGKSPVADVAGQWSAAENVAPPGSLWPRLAMLGMQVHLVYSNQGSLERRVLDLGSDAKWSAAEKIPGLQSVPVEMGGAAGSEAPFLLAADAQRLHLVQVVQGETRLNYIFWQPAPEGGAWSAVETLAPAGRWENLPGGAAFAAPAGGLLAVAWRAALTGQAAVSTPGAAPAAAQPGAYYTQRQIPEHSVPTALPELAQMPPALQSPTPQAAVLTPTATLALSVEASPSRPFVGPLELGIGLVVLIVAALFVGVLVRGGRK
jgi:hypothetical protein